MFLLSDFKVIMIAYKELLEEDIAFLVLSEEEMSKNKRKNKRKNKWIKPHHQIVRDIACLILKPYSILKYGIKVEKFREDKKRNYLVLYNHQTPFDQFFVGMAFREHVYYVATEDIFSNGFVSSLIKYLVAPIPIKKQSTDVRAILNCIKVAKEGGTIVMAPEGNRTYSGKTEYINPAVTALAKKLGLPVLIYRLEGGYGVHPRWSDVVRKGKMRGYVSKVIEPEEYRDLPDEEFLAIINKELYVNEAEKSGKFRHKKSAEYLERAIYVCPYCGLSEFESHGDIVECKKCGRKVRYRQTKELEGVRFEFPFKFVNEWYEYQNEFVNSLDVTTMVKAPVWKDCIRLFEVIPYKKKIPLEKEAVSELYGDRIAIIGDSGEKTEYSFEDITVIAVLGRNKMNFYHGGKIYQVRGSKRFNALKYLNFYYRYKNIKKGDSENGKFLGL